MTSVALDESVESAFLIRSMDLRLSPLHQNRSLEHVPTLGPAACRKVRPCAKVPKAFPGDVSALKELGPDWKTDT